MTPKLSLVVPCYNESATLEACVARILAIASADLTLEIVIVDDASSDDSLDRARRLAARHPEIRVLAHDLNCGKGAALRTGFRQVTGDFVAVQDADLEYNPRDLLRLLEPLVAGEADAVLGSRYLTGGAHRVLDYWHSAGNRFLTFVSNAFCDLDLTDIETCYKVFRRDVIQSIEIEEDRFGFEPEIVAKLAGLRLRIFEARIQYDGRTAAEGKKIRARDGWRALYCILRYNARQSPIPIRFAVYGMIATGSAIANLATFALLRALGSPLVVALGTAFTAGSLTNFWLCRSVLFPLDGRHDGRGDAARFAGVALIGMLLDGTLTMQLIGSGLAPVGSKLIALLPFPMLDFLIRRRFVFGGAATPTAGAR